MITQKEIDAILKLSPEKRYEYLIKRIADFEEVWTLYNDDVGFATNVEDDGSQWFPIWPSKGFSDLWRGGSFSKYHSKNVSIYNFKEKTLPALKEMGIGILAFPIENGKGQVMEISKFVSDLESEMEQYE